MTSARSDALALFGVTGDLAHKMIFPALYAMAKRGALTVPVIGVARAKWSVERLHERVQDSLKLSGGIDDRPAFDHLLSKLSYVSSDYNDQGTYEAIRKALGEAKCPAYYLAIPPSLFEMVIMALGASKLAERARVIVEKPFGRDLASARNLNRAARAVFPEDAICWRSIWIEWSFTASERLPRQVSGFMFAQSKSYPDMIDMVARLKIQDGLKIAVVSNEARELNAYRIQKFKLGGFVDFFISSCFVHIRKPDADIFRLALDIAQVPARQVLYIESTPTFVEIAEGFGIRSILPIDYRSTWAQLATRGLQNGEGAGHETG